MDKGLLVWKKLADNEKVDFCDKLDFYDWFIRLFLQKKEFRQFAQEIFPQLKAGELFNQLIGMLLFGKARLISHEKTKAFEYRFIFDEEKKK